MEQRLKKYLEQIKANQISEIPLSDKGITDTQVILLAEILKHNQSLTTLSLGQSNW